MIAIHLRYWALAGAAGLLFAAAGCMHSVDSVGEVSGPLGASADDGGGADAGSGEAAAPACDLTKPFDPPTLVAGLDDRDVLSARFSPDERSAFIAAFNGANGSDIFTATRASAADPFVIGAPATELDTAADEYWPTLSADGEMIFFESSRTFGPNDGGALGNSVSRIWAATRASADGGFGQPTILGIFRVDGGPEAAPYLHHLGRSLYFASSARGGKGDMDLFVADITDFGVVTAVRSVDSANSANEENMPVVSADERALFFARPDVGNDDSKRDIWVVGRDSASRPFGVAQQVVELNTEYDEFPSWASTDGCRLYLVSNRPVAGTQRYRVWLASKPTE